MHLQQDTNCRWLAVVLLSGAMLMTSLKVQSQWSPAEIYGDHGALNTEISVGPDVMIRHALLPDGRVMLAGGGFDVGCQCYYISMMQVDTVCGTLDPMFGTGGKIRHVFSQRSSLTDLKVLPDGRYMGCGMVALGSGVSQQTNGVYRFNADGTPDPTFGTGGWRSDRFGTNLAGSNLAILPMNNGRSCAVGGTSYNIDGSQNGRGIMRFTADGQLDTDFSGDGMHWVQNSISLVGHTGLLMADSSVLWIGTDASAGNNLFFTRFATNGTSSDHSVAAGPGNTLPVIARMLPDGRILLGYTNVLDQFETVRINPDLTLDATYGVDGVSAVDASLLPERAYGLEVLDDGSTLQYGSSSNGTLHFVIKRTPDGVLDPTFGTDGVLQLPTFPTAVSIRGGIPMPGGTGMLLYGEGSQGSALLLKVTTQPAATALPVIEVQGRRLHATGSGPFEWYLNDLPITGEYDADYTPLDTGVFKVRMPLTAGCSYASPPFHRFGNSFDAVTPRHLYTTGDHLIRLHGHFYIDSCTVDLIGPGGTYSSSTTSVNDAREVAAVLLLDGAVPGLYDVVLNAPTFVDTLPQAIELVPGTIGYDKLPNVEVLGNTLMIVGSTGTRTIRITNPWPGMIYAVPVMMQLDTQLDPQPDPGIGNHVIENQYTNEVRTNFMTANDFVTFDPDEVIGDQPRNFGWFMVPAIEPESYVDVRVGVHPSGMDCHEVVAFTAKQWLTEAEIAGLELMRTSCDFIPEKMQCMVDLAEYIPGGGCVVSALNVGCSIGNIANDIVGTRHKKDADLLNLAADMIGVVTCTTPGGAELFPQFVNTEMKKMMYGALGKGVSMLQASAEPTSSNLALIGGTAIPPGCRELAEDALIPTAQFLLCGVLSIDPNTKVGPEGVGLLRYLPTNTTLSYSVLFENMDSATAPAREVFIRDTLDLSLVDPSTFSFTSFGWDTFRIELRPGQDHFIHDQDLRPAKNALLRVVGRLDRLSGEVLVSFRSFDPITLELTEDVAAGFLDPNVNGVQGQGEVSYSVRQHAHLPHGTEIRNEATIVFDLNDPILTPAHSNRIDAEAPESAVLPITDLTGPSLVVRISGSDADAGVRAYDLVIVQNDLDTFYVRLPDGVDSVQFDVTANGHYKFYTIATDHVGNRELPPASGYDVELILDDTGIREGVVEGSFNVFPNPADDSFSLSFMLVEPGLTSIELVDAKGRRVAQLLTPAQRAAGPYNERFSLSPDLGSGIYAVVLRTVAGTMVTKLIRD